MEFERDIAPPPAEPQRVLVEPEPEPPRRTRAGMKTFSEALAVVESHRSKVQTALGLSLIARLLAEVEFIPLSRLSETIVQQLPFIGLAMLSYMIVLWFLAARTRDRWGFGMALGIGVLQSVYMIVMIVVGQMWNSPSLIWKPAVVALTHIALAISAFRAGGAYPPADSKKPWVFGFATAFIFVVIPWVAVPLAEAIGW
jgi:hypothetical protein